VNITEVSKASGIPKEFLGETASRMGYALAGDYIFAKDKLKDIEKSILKMGKTSLDAVSQRIGFDPTTTVELLHKLGIRLVFKSFDPSEIIISP